MIVENVRALLAKGHTKEAAALIKRVAPVPLSIPEARELLLLMADAILQSVPRGRGDKVNLDEFATFAKSLSMSDEVDRRSPGESVEAALENVGEKFHKSASTVKRNRRKNRKAT